MRRLRPDEPPRAVPLGIAGLPGTDEEKKYIRQASLMLRYRIWMRDAHAAAPTPAER